MAFHSSSLHYSPSLGSSHHDQGHKNVTQKHFLAGHLGHLLLSDKTYQCLVRQKVVSHSYKPFDPCLSQRNIKTGLDKSPLMRDRDDIWSLSCI